MVSQQGAAQKQHYLVSQLHAAENLKEPTCYNLQLMIKLSVGAVVWAVLNLPFTLLCSPTAALLTSGAGRHTVLGHSARGRHSTGGHARHATRGGHHAWGHGSGRRHAAGGACGHPAHGGKAALHGRSQATHASNGPCQTCRGHAHGGGCDAAACGLGYARTNHAVVRALARASGCSLNLKTDHIVAAKKNQTEWSSLCALLCAKRKPAGLQPGNSTGECGIWTQSIPCPPDCVLDLTIRNSSQSPRTKFICLSKARKVPIRVRLQNEPK